MTHGLTVEEAGEELLWTIGDRDRGKLGLSPRWFMSAETMDPVFVVGESDARSDWPRFHPGPLNASTGYQELSATVRFQAPADSQEFWHLLQLSAEASHGPCPDLRLEINGHRALVVPRPVRSDRAHAPSPPSPVGGVIERVVTIPPGCVRPGENVLVLTTVAAEPAEPEELTRAQRPDLGVWFGSALTWSGLSLRRRTDRPTPPTAMLEPLPLYVHGSDGLDELVDLLIFDTEKLPSGPIRVSIGDWQSDAAIDVAGREFGDVRARFARPEWTGQLPSIVDAESVVAEQVVAPARKWTVHVLPHVHLDIGYTDAQAKVLELHSRNVDQALNLLQQVPDYAFSVDGSFILEGFLRSRDVDQQERALAAIRSGRIGVNGFWALLLSGVASLEVLYRALYLTARLRREADLPVTYANLTDVPSYTWAVPSVLASAGIDGFMGISNHTRGGNADSDTLHMLSPVRWVGPDGGSVIAFFSDCYSQLRWICADPPTLSGAADGLTRCLRRYDRADYAPGDLPVVGTHADNEDLSHGYANFVGRWNDKYAWPRLRFSTIGEYLDTVRPLADSLPVLTGDGGSYWEDGVGTQARAISVHRRTEPLLSAAELASALVTATASGLVPDTETLDHGWECLLIGCEHTWTSSHATIRPHSHHSIDQLDWKVSRIDAGIRIATDESRRALSQLAAEINAPVIPSLVVVNPASWTRDLFIDVELEANQVARDTSGEPLAREALGPVRDGLRQWRLHVPAVPAFGYRLLPLSAEQPEPAEEFEPAPSTLETPHYTVRLDPDTGQVMGLRHKALDREILDTSSDWGLGDVLYVTGGGTEQGRGLGDEATGLFDYDPNLGPANLQVTTATTQPGRIRRTPWGWTITCVGEGPSLPHIQRELRLYENSDRVELTVTLDKEPVLAKESVYVAFPFDVPHPTVHYDRQQGWVDPARDHVIGACHEWLTIQHAVCVNNDDLAVMWAAADAPLFTIGDIVRGRWPRQFETTNGTIFSWAMNNYWMTNTPASQDGRVELRYALQPATSFDPAAAGRLGRDLRTPALVSDITYTDRCDDTARQREAAGTLLDADLPEHVVASVFAGRAAPGIVVRLQEIAGREATATLTHPSTAPNATAQICTATEDPSQLLQPGPDGRIQIQLRPYEVVTLALSVGSGQATQAG